MILQFLIVFFRSFQLTGHILAKEKKHVRHRLDLKVTENVKIKAKGYIKDYMSRMGPVYEPRDHDMDLNSHTELLDDSLLAGTRPRSAASLSNGQSRDGSLNNGHHAQLMDDDDAQDDDDDVRHDVTDSNSMDGVNMNGNSSSSTAPQQDSSSALAT